MEIDVHALARSGLIFLHLVSLTLAACAIAFGDYAIFKGQAVDRPLRATSCRAVAWTLGLLWLTGLGVLALDVGFKHLSITGNPKVLAKLTVATALTTNGWLMHRFVFASLGQPSPHALRNARIAAVTGAVSAVSWGYALFLGVAKAWSPLLGLGGFLGGYVLATALGAACAWRWMVPLLMLKNRGFAPAAMLQIEVAGGLGHRAALCD
ncbi:MAG: hypothetical protein KKC79_09535 [Gammaproteobacteria bacterium]|nr:hypothetical protein [Gammaproteobacteria bacterium]MBU1442057.1 hypothetical protein [Gammaproteobacteria bacterium]MBU2287492.1 hypothetical protein [Gammaproteobacteria bacterium]MBU2408875.1 hypothetical protein [Gammaproteobacteria bacterium]